MWLKTVIFNRIILQFTMLVRKIIISKLILPFVSWIIRLVHQTWALPRTSGYWWQGIFRDIERSLRPWVLSAKLCSHPGETCKLSCRVCHNKFVKSSTRMVEELTIECIHVLWIYNFKNARLWTPIRLQYHNFITGFNIHFSCFYLSFLMKEVVDQLHWSPVR